MARARYRDRDDAHGARDRRDASVAARHAGPGLLGAHAWTSGVAFAVGASYALEGRASVDGVTVAGSARRALTTTVALQIPAGPLGRIVGSVFASPPIPGASAGEAATLGLSLALIRPWS